MSSRRPGRLLRTAGTVLAVLLLAVLVDGFLVEPYSIAVRSVTVPLPGLRGAVRVMLFSDVDFRGVGRRERTIREAALGFEPDLILIAGDFLDNERALEDPETVAAAGRFLMTLPAGQGRFLAPGEEESPLASRLRSSWSGEGIQIVSNEERTLRIRGETLRLFIADAEAEPAPWWTGTEGDRAVVASSGRTLAGRFSFEGSAAIDWSDVEISLSMKAVDPETYLEVSVLPDSGGTGWSLVKYESRGYFRIYPAVNGRPAIAGVREVGFRPPFGDWRRMKVRVTGEGEVCRVRARVWSESEPEPGDWSLDVSDRRLAPSPGATLALGARRGRRLYADLSVADGGGRTLLEERFEDPGGLPRQWSVSSELSEWIGRRGEGAAVVVAHTPDVALEVMGLSGGDPFLLLAGHTHGGQIRLPFVGAPFTSTVLGRAYDSGLFRLGGGRLYITAGVGTSVVPFRFLCRPEITLLTLVPQAGH